MSFPVLITQRQVELKIGGPKILIQFCDDDGDGRADPDVVVDMLQAASDEGGGILFSAWSVADIVKLLADDSNVVKHFCFLFARQIGMRRPELADAITHKTIFWDAGADAEHQLVLMIEAKRRSGSEEKVITENPLAQNFTVPGHPRTFEFAPSAKRPYVGGGF